MAIAPVSRRKRRGSRKGRGGPSHFADINVTPFVDVMLVLLIVFMVTAPLLTMGVEVQLPRTEAKQMAADTAPLTVTIRSDGAIYIQDEAIAFEELLPKLEALASEGFDSRIFIRADAKADWEQVARVLARISAAGYRNLGLPTDSLEEPLRGRR